MLPWWWEGSGASTCFSGGCALGTVELLGKWDKVLWRGRKQVSSPGAWPA